jgi:predicted alpha/beta-hydrolase family hydrolase
MQVVIAHGASGSAASMRGHVEGLAARGIDAVAIDLPLRAAEAAVPAYREALRAIPGVGPHVLAGQSYGGRVASLLAAEDPVGAAGLICFSYPLHRPGQPDWEARTSHWPRLRLPVLLLCGAADPFARLDLLERARGERLPAARLVTWPKVGHSLKPVLAEALDEAAASVRGLEETRLGEPSPG